MVTFHTDAFIGNKWVANLSGASFAVNNPANGQKIADVTDSDCAMAQNAVAAAYAAFPKWSSLLASQRQQYLNKLADILTQRSAELSALLTMEQGKPLREARAEVASAIAQLRWNADEALRLRGETLPPFRQHTAATVTHEPLGVVLALCPWNFPVGMVLRKIAPALAVGCTVILKPAPETPLCALFIAQAAQDAGLPDGVLNILPVSRDSTEQVAGFLVKHKDIAKVSFTGSTRVGRLLMAQASDSLKRLSLELGGNAPFLVFPSANLEQAVDGLIASKFRNAGQTCICVNRAFVAAEIAEEFNALVLARLQALKVGDGTLPDSDIGPLISMTAVEKAQSHLHDAVAKGGICLSADTAATGQFMPPCLVTGLHDGMMMFNEETFGPILGIGQFVSESEALALANQSEYGLAAYFYSKDLGQCHRVSAALQYGMVGVNDTALADASIPFGGVKQSGFGREGSHNGLLEFTAPKYCLWGGLQQSARDIKAG